MGKSIPIIIPSSAGIITDLILPSPTEQFFFGLFPFIEIDFFKAVEFILGKIIVVESFSSTSVLKQAV